MGCEGKTGAMSTHIAIRAPLRSPSSPEWHFVGTDISNPQDRVSGLAARLHTSIPFLSLTLLRDIFHDSS